MSTEQKAISGLVNRFNELTSTRGVIDNTLQDLSEFIMPNRGDFTQTRSEGDRRTTFLFDITAEQANQFFASALQTGLTSPFTEWFQLSPESLDPALQDNREVKIYLESVNDLLFKVFNDPKVGFNQQNHQMMLDLGAYGTGIVFVDETPDGSIRFNTRHLSEIYLEENNLGLVDTIYRKFKFTAKQFVQQWGEEKATRSVMDKLKKNVNDKFEILHVTMPKVDYHRSIGTSLPKHLDRFEYISCYILMDELEKIEVSGFHEFPWITPRWEVLVGETYGRGPGWSSLTDIRMANAMMETMIRASQKAADPPILMADDGVVMPLQTMPGGVNIGGVSQDGRPLMQPFVSGARLDINDAMVERTRDNIRRTFFVDTLIDKANRPQQTATEVMDRRDIRFQLMGPQLARLRSEYLDPLINRVFGILQRKGVLPEPPEALQGQDLEIRYMSPLIRTQRQDELNSLNQAIQSIGFLAQVDPSILEVVDGKKTFSRALDTTGFPESLRRSEDELQQLEEQRAQQQQQAQMENLISSGADAISKLEKSGVDTGVQ